MNEKFRKIQGAGIILIFVGSAITIVNMAPVFLIAMTFGLIQFQTTPFLFNGQVSIIGAGIVFWGIIFLAGIPVLLYLWLYYFISLFWTKINAVRG